MSFIRSTIHEQHSFAMRTLSPSEDVSCAIDQVDVSHGVVGDVDLRVSTVEVKRATELRDVDLALARRYRKMICGMV